MFGIDGPEFLVILLVLIVVVGPKDLPKMLRTIAKALAYVRSTANEFRYQFDDAMRQVELDDLQKTSSDISDLNPRKELTEIFNPIHNAVGDIHDSFDINTIHHKSEKDKEVLVCGQNKTNEDSTVSVGTHRLGSISVNAKDGEGAS
ncbi:Sec-independent protein translocase protein TatB [Bartonella gliris]|uniref:Sec-independent protein translocase protein TatB n=1 Tax=Bartonella gliris TaxID=3004109 RepID=UPI00295EE219|nr:Sec-independent protein translocase protein TatB [Bartonella gliris]